MMIPDLVDLMRAGQCQQRSIIVVDIVDHDADCEDVVISVRIERPVLVPLDCCAAMRQLHIQFRAVKANVRSK